MIQEQQDALAVLSEIWQLSPDVRLGQLFAHLGFLGEVHVGRGSASRSCASSPASSRGRISRLGWTNPFKAIMTLPQPTAFSALIHGRVPVLSATIRRRRIVPGDVTPIISLRETAIAKEPGSSYPD